MPDQTAGLRPGDPAQVGGYRIVGRLGEGGMGAVFLARSAEGRQVAVKVVRPELARSEAFVVRFQAEVANAQRVASFCTAQVLDHGEDGGLAYMVTEYIDGMSLLEYVRANGPLPQGMLHGVAVGVAAALVSIHGAGLIHRDLKPANVLLSLSGPRVIDFGIARALDSAGSLTRSGQLIGSPGWMAPEQIRFSEVSTAADIFTWGVLVCYAGSGVHPYGTGEFAMLAARIATGEPSLPALPPPLDRLVRQALSRDPADRPSAQQLLLALVGGNATDTAVLTSLNQTWTPTRVLPDESTRQSAAPPTVPPGQVPPGSVPPGQVPTSPVPVGYQPPPDERTQGGLVEPPTRAGSGTRKGRRAAIAAGAAIVVAGGAAAAVILLQPDGGHHGTAVGGAATTPAAATLHGDVVVRLGDLATKANCDARLGRLNPATGESTPYPGTAGQCTDLPEVSPNNQLVAFNKIFGTGSNVTGQLWVMRADGTDQTKITDIPGRGHVAWGPDSKAIAYSGNTPDGTPQIFTITLSVGTGISRAGGPVQVTHEAAGAASPGWSKKNVLAYVHTDGTPTAIFGQNMTNQGTPVGQPSPIIQAAERITEPTFDRTGDRLLYCEGPGGATDLWLLNMSDKQSTRLTSTGANNEDPTWTFDNKDIIFATGDYGHPTLKRLTPGSGRPADSLGAVGAQPSA